MAEITVKKEEWVKDNDLWYIHIKTPFEVSEDTETILQLADDQDYIDEHKEDFDSLQNGETHNNEVVISSTKQPECDMKFDLKTLEEAGGKIMYDKDGKPEYIPDNNGLDLLSAFGGMNMMDMINSEGVIDIEPELNSEGVCD